MWGVILIGPALYKIGYPSGNTRNTIGKSVAQRRRIACRLPDGPIRAHRTWCDYPPASSTYIDALWQTPTTVPESRAIGLSEHVMQSAASRNRYRADWQAVTARQCLKCGNSICTAMTIRIDHQ
jgi:hypothetical protein